MIVVGIAMAGIVIACLAGLVVLTVVMWIEWPPLGVAVTAGYVWLVRYVVRGVPAAKAK